MNIKKYIRSNEDLIKKIGFILSLITIIMVMFYYLKCIENIYNSKISNISKNEVVEIEEELFPKENSVSVASLAIETEINEEDMFIFREEIPLSEDLQRFVYEESQKYDIPDTLVYAIMYVESRFDTNAKSHTNDSGLLQINSQTAKWIARELGLKEYDLHDPKTNIKFSLWYLNSLKEVWSSVDMSEEDRAYMIVSSYNLGVTGSKRYVAKNGMNIKYTEKVFEYKNKLEEGDLNRQVQ